MEIKRGEPPKNVERALSIELNSDEILVILTQYIKRKMNTDRIRIDGIGATLSKDSGRLMTMSLTGAEVIPLAWSTPPAPTEAVTSTPPPATVPNGLK